MVKYMDTEVIVLRILHTADWHLGIELHKESRIEEQRYFIHQLETIIEKERIDVVLIAGDIYDTALASKEAIELWNEAIQMICGKMKRKAICIAGNHDSPTRLSIASGLLTQTGLYIYGKLEETLKPQVIDDVYFYPLPFLHPQRVAHLYQTTCTSLQQAYETVLNDITKNMDETKKNILIGHLFMTGSQVSESDRFVHVGGSDAVTKDIFEKFSYVALGHLHRNQKLSDKIYYSGSPLKYSFSEAKHEKKVMIYDTETDEVSSHVIEQLHPLEVIKGTLKEVEEQLQEVNVQSYVKVELDEFLQYETIAYLKERYPMILTIQGKQSNDKIETKLEMNDLTTWKEEDIVAQFLKDYYDMDMGEFEKELLKEAFEEIEGGEAYGA